MKKRRLERALLYDNGRWLCNTYSAFLETYLPVKAPPNACLFFPLEKFRNFWYHLSSSITNRIHLMLLDIHGVILAQPKHLISYPRKEVKESSTPELVDFYQPWQDIITFWYIQDMAQIGFKHVRANICSVELILCNSCCSTALQSKYTGWRRHFLLA